MNVTELPNVTLVREVGSNQSTSANPFYEWVLVASPTEGTADHPVMHSYGDWESATAENATHAILDLTTWSDYSGSTVERSNERSLLRDFPQTFIRLYGGYGTRGLMLPVNMPESYDEDTWNYLLDELAALGDYPLYDEEDLSALEMELADEAWDGYLNWDIPRDLENRGVNDEVIDENIERIKERFYTLTMEADYGPEAESAVSVVFPFYDKTLDQIAYELREAQ